jgi:hypothetical protein
VTTHRSVLALVLSLCLLAGAAASASPPAASGAGEPAEELATTAEPTEATPPALERVAQPMVMTRMERWVGSFNGCQDGATPEERMMTASLEYTCACLATYIVNLCAPTDATTNDQVMACFGVNEMAVQNAFNRCLSYGALQVTP